MFSWADCIFALLYLFSTQSLCYSITFTKIFWAISGLTSFTLIFTGIYCKQHLKSKIFFVVFLQNDLGHWDHADKKYCKLFDMNQYFFRKMLLIQWAMLSCYYFEHLCVYANQRDHKYVGFQLFLFYFFVSTSSPLSWHRMLWNMQHCHEYFLVHIVIHESVVTPIHPPCPVFVGQGR